MTITRHEVAERLSANQVVVNFLNSTYIATDDFNNLICKSFVLPNYYNNNHIIENMLDFVFCAKLCGYHIDSDIYYDAMLWDLHRIITS